MNVLFVVCGEGLGHTSRCLHTARYLEAHGFTCHFAAYDTSFRFLQRQGWQRLHRTPREVTLAGNNGFFTLTGTLNDSKGVPVNMYRSYRMVQDLIDAEHIDLVVADTMYAAVVAARRKGVPTVFITNQNTFCTLSGESAAAWKALGRMVSSFFSLPDAIVVPDFAPPDTISGYNLTIPDTMNGKVRFVGPMLAIDRAAYPVSSDTVFASFGGEPFKVPLYHRLADIARRREDLSFSVFSNADGLPPASKNFTPYGFVPDLYPHLARAKVAILHGGLTSLHESLFFGKPVVVVIDPHHPEQGNNARKIQDMGAGVIVRGDTATEDNLEAAIDAAAALRPPGVAHLFGHQDGRTGTLRVIEEIL
ncbi:glycosyl transferase family 28 [Methanomicrobiaceae archaeon CYW5]|uniref:glycosyltransferase family protein n=1 Tax=Methanovulcanius yangii TaxID=1789227 RepID=UPI0029CA4F93|nr:glycosyltransferase family protein [Methanovulcanius yangii]MBT8508140.1 glycosyl transferase family 28 [Methanovulcanius yangii]